MKRFEADMSGTGPVELAHTSVVIARAVYDTLRVSVPTFAQGAIGGLTVEVADRRLDSWSRSLLEAAQIELTVSGQEHARTDELFVVMSNHQSLYDIPVIYQSVPRSIRMVAKKELFEVPVWGRAMRAAGFIELDRKNRRKAVESLKAAGEAMHKQRVCIWIAPEGTRSPDSSVREFKRGGFHLARQAGVRILPVSISSTADALPAREWHVHKGARVHAHISPPVDPRSCDGNRLGEFVEEVRNTIARHVVNAPPSR